MARTNQKPPVSKDPAAAGNRGKGQGAAEGEGWEPNSGRENTARQGRGKEKREWGRGGVSWAGKRAVKGKERAVRATNRGLGKRKGSRGRECINKTSQTWSSGTLSKMCKGEKNHHDVSNQTAQTATNNMYIQSPGGITQQH